MMYLLNVEVESYLLVFICFSVLKIQSILMSNCIFTVPLVVIFTKFDGQIIKEYTDLNDMENPDKWDEARENAERTFQTVYLPRVMDTKYPPKAYLQLEGRHGEYSLHKDNSLG